MNQQVPDVNDLWVRHQRRNHKTTASWTCEFCVDKRVFLSSQDLWDHALLEHLDKLPTGDEEALHLFRKDFEVRSAQKRPWNDPQPRKLSFDKTSNTQHEPPPGQGKRPLSTPTTLAQKGSLSGLKALHLGRSPGENADVSMVDASEDDDLATPDQPRKRAAIGDGISDRSASPFRDSSASPPPRRSKARPTSAPYGSVSESDQGRPHVLKKHLWTPDSPSTRASVDPSNIASVHAQKSRAQVLPPKARKAFQSPSQVMSSRPPLNQNSQHPQKITPSAIFGSKTAQSLQSPQASDTYAMTRQPETRPISQEQLVAEVKGIYAGLVMVEAKCIEVDNKQAQLTQADSGAQPKLNHEQWQALIALHRTLLHEHHDFFLASQHPSASPALRRLASKYAMPARMWRHGIHSFLELLRHRLPLSLDHMLAFIYLAYSMMALLYETVPAFEDTWIECLGDLGRYRMAIEDDDIRDREVWTGVARYWYAKASDKAPTTGRLYHHLAILARPNVIQQLFYYAKSLCVVIPFPSARESILTLFEPVLNAETQYRMAPFDAAFVKVHGLLFMNKDMDRFEPALAEFLGLLDTQIGRVTRKFMDQGGQIAIANGVAMLGFASKDNALMRAISSSAGDDGDIQMKGATTDSTSQSMISFINAQRLANSTLGIVLSRIGDPNVLPFIHVTLVFMYRMSRHPGAMSILEANFPWRLLATMLNTLLASYGTSSRIEDDKFPLPIRDDVRPFTEDLAMRGLLWADNYFPDQFFSNEKIDDEEKHLEVASMREERKERILWLGCRLANAGPWIQYDSDNRQFTVPSTGVAPAPLDSRSSTFASATTIDRVETWPPAEADVGDVSDAD